MSDVGNSLAVDADSYYIELIKEVSTAIKKCTGCKLKDGNTLEDLVTNYSILLSCVTSHSTNIEKNRDVEIFYKIFLIEKYLLKFICEPEILTVCEALRGNYNNQKIKEDIAVCSEKNYKGVINALNCEQDIESLTFKYYKHVTPQMDVTTTEISEYVLLVLYMRREYVRFFKIYNHVEHSLFSNRLAILLTFNDDCEFTAKCENIKNKSFIDLQIINKEVQDIARLTFLENEDYETWKKGVEYFFNWNEKVRLWIKNRCNSSCLLDKSMIDECIRSKNYNDGWIIYKQGNSSIVNEYQKIIILCIEAIRHTSDDLWTNRLLEVMDMAIDKHDLHICCDLVQDIFYKLGGVCEKQRSKIVKHFIKKIRVMENNEEIVTYIIKGINELCKECINTETCDLCVAHANLIYTEWKKNNTGGFFFKSHSKFETEIYESMLDMCDTIDDCNGFRSVCKDLVNNDAKINKGIYKKLQIVHNKTCKNCKHENYKTLKVQDEHLLLNYIFSGFHL